MFARQNKWVFRFLLKFTDNRLPIRILNPKTVEIVSNLMYVTTWFQISDKWRINLVWIQPLYSKYLSIYHVLLWISTYPRLQRSQCLSSYPVRTSVSAQLVSFFLEPEMKFVYKLRYIWCRRIKFAKMLMIFIWLFHPPTLTPYLQNLKILQFGPRTII